MEGRNANGMTLIELLVGMSLGLVGAAALTTLLRAGVAAGTRAGTSAEAAIEASAAVDQLVRDVRVAGYDPTGAGIAAFSVLAADRVEIQADLDGNGTIDASSDERIGWRVATSSRSLQRVIGAQTLPILSDVSAAGFRLAYLDASGARLDPTVPASVGTTRMVEIDLTASPAGRPAVHVHGGTRLVNR